MAVAAGPPDAADEADIAVLIGGNDFRIYTVKRDLDLEKLIIDKEKEFWHEHVLAKRMPPIDASGAAKRYLANRYPRDVEPLREATASEFAFLDAYMVPRQEKKLAEDQFKVAENQLKDLIGDSGGIKTRLGNFKWPTTKDSYGVDYARLCETMKKRLKYKEKSWKKLLDEHTIMKKRGGRRLSVPQKWVPQIEGGKDDDRDNQLDSQRKNPAVGKITEGPGGVTPSPDAEDDA